MYLIHKFPLTYWGEEFSLAEIADNALGHNTNTFLKRFNSPPGEASRRSFRHNQETGISGQYRQDRGRAGFQPGEEVQKMPFRR